MHVMGLVDSISILKTIIVPDDRENIIREWTSKGMHSHQEVEKGICVTE